MTPDILHIFSVGAVILGVGVIISAVLGYLYKLDREKEYVLVLLVPTVAALMYAVMSSGVGIIQGFDGSVNIARYADWIITTPLLLYILSSVLSSSTAQKWRTFFVLAGADILMLLTGLGAEFYMGELKILFFAISMVAYIGMLYVIIDLLVKLDRGQLSRGQISSALGMAWVILILWSLYPFVWVFGTKGVATIGMEAETIVYLILDVFSKLGFAALLGRYLHLDTEQDGDAHIEINHA